MKSCKIYTDGSHIKKSNYIGYGACFENPENRIYIISGKFSIKTFELRYHQKVSNPTAEMIAVLMAIKSLLGLKNHFITIYSDYNGVQKWINGEWKITKPYIQDITNEIHRLMKIHKKNNVNFDYKWIKGHSNDKMNDIADTLARKKSGENTFWKYFKNQ